MRNGTRQSGALSTGIVALDSRLGGLVPSRYYLVSGGAGAGKTSMALHFLGAGLEAGERCAILTQDDPEDLLAQADFLGYDLRTAAEQEQLFVLQYRLDFAHNYTRTSDPEPVLQELVAQLGGEMPSRFVVDSILPFVDTGGAMHEMVGVLAYLLDHLTSTTYLIVPGDVAESHYWSAFDRIRAAAAGIFHLQIEQGRVRELSIRKLRQTAVSTDPLRFVIRAGVGMVVHQEGARSLADIPHELQRRVVVLDAGCTLPAELHGALELAYDLRIYKSVEEGFAELSGGAFGVLLVVLDPRNPQPMLSLARELRKAGNGVPILFVSSSRDLRSSTRSKGLRMGADDFVTDDLSVQEFLERVEVARVRGHRPPMEAAGAEGTILQPAGEQGEALPIQEDELRRAVRHQIEHSGHPFFALVFLRAAPFSQHETWRILCDDLRVREGDLVALTHDGGVAMYLHDINRRAVKELLTRIVQAHPELAGVRGVEVYSYPADRAEIESWLLRPEPVPKVEARQ